ncbi:MAG: hypothetical protein AABY07_06345 [Nanoarchaeota archaeon]
MSFKFVLGAPSWYIALPDGEGSLDDYINEILKHSIVDRKTLLNDIGSILPDPIFKRRDGCEWFEINILSLEKAEEIMLEFSQRFYDVVSKYVPPAYLERCGKLNYLLLSANDMSYYVHH